MRFSLGFPMSKAQRRSAEYYYPRPETDCSPALPRSWSAAHDREQQWFRPAARAPFSCSERMILSNDPPGRSVRPMLPANSVSPAISFFSSRKVEADAAFGVAGRVHHIGLQDPAVTVSACPRLWSISTLPGGHPQPRRLHIQHLQQRIVVLVEQDGRAGDRAQLHGPAHVIDVRVSDHDLLDLQIVFADDRQHIVNVVAGIDDHGLARGSHRQ